MQLYRLFAGTARHFVGFVTPVAVQVVFNRNIRSRHVFQRQQVYERLFVEAAPPFFVLSLKAGGTGLNLTRANHVIMFDRWWNPAVEQQAVDRAYRIGQKSNVQVHYFSCKGTLEDKIEKLIENKRELAEMLVGTGETWLTELDDSDLHELFSLDKDAVETL